LSKFFFAAGFWLTLTLLFEIISYILDPEIYQFSVNLKKFIPLFFIVLIGIPIQAGFEELFMRGYLLQAIGLIVKYRWVPLVITSLLFGLLHSLNPEIKEFGFSLMMVYYIGVGLFLAIITLMDDGLELALGVHIISNIYASLIVTYQGSALKTSALFKVTELNTELMLAGYFICAVLFILIAAYKYNWIEWDKLYRKISR
jgi:membrane protease YdiL (CAAX protease family)